MNIQHKLKAWVTEGLLTSAQADAILAFETRVPQRSWVLFGIAGIGVTAVGTGIVSIVAANWERIPPTVKLLNYFAWQIGLALFALRQFNRPGLARECAITLFSAVFLAGIGLVGQIYNLVSSGWEGILFWLALILMPTLAVQSRLLPHLWFLGLTVAAGIWSSGESVPMLKASLLSYLVLALGLWRGAPVSPWFQRAALLWGLFFTVAGLSLLGSTFYYSARSRPYPFELGMLAPVLGAVLCAIPILLSDRASRLKGTLLAMTSLSALYLVLPILVPLAREELLACAGFVVIWAFAAASAALSEHRRLFDLATLAIGIRFVVVYFEVFGSLAATGVGLIISGVLILAAAFGWHRYRNHLRHFLGGT